MTVFITREQTPASDLTRLLEAQGWQVQGQSLVTLTALPFDHIPDTDWIFFSSKNAVRFFFQQIHENHLRIPEVKWAALGKSTAEALARHIPNINFIGNGNPGTTAETFRQQIGSEENMRVLFPAARHSMKSMARHLPENSQTIHLEVYDNQPVPNPEPRTEDVLVFTSPMNVRAYFSHHALLSGQKTVAIGPTTAAALSHYGVKDVVVAKEPSERSIVSRIFSLRE